MARRTAKRTGEGLELAQWFSGFELSIRAPEWKYILCDAEEPYPIYRICSWSLRTDMDVTISQQNWRG